MATMQRKDALMGHKHMLRIDNKLEIITVRKGKRLL